MGWKPIDIAPRNGARIVVAYRSPVTDEVSVSVSWWNDKEGWEEESPSGESVPMKGLVPFAWTELPES